MRENKISISKPGERNASHNSPSLQRYVPHCTMRKLFIISILIFLTLFSKSQEISAKAPQLQFSINDTSSARIKWYPERTTRIPMSENPLVIINEKQFKYCDFSNLYFDISSVSNINVLSPKNDSSKLYGKAGRNGIIILNTKHTIYWVTSRQILRQQSKSLFHTHRKTILKINNNLIDPTEKVYIQKDLIKSVSIDNDAIEFFADKEYNKVISITLTQKRGT